MPRLWHSGIERDENMTKLTYEQIMEKLIEQGIGKGTIEHSKIFARVLDIVSGEDVVLEFQSLKQQIPMMKTELRRLDDERRRVRNWLDEERRLANGLADDRRSKHEELIKRFLKALEEGETPEGRDTLRKAQMFVNSVQVNTKYDNTAYIAGLAAILSNGEISALGELKKINTDL